ncbi:MAG: Hpt domain [Myxococcales bacterium]|nr:Hpt domain [Myxococcales bacterium]
MEPHARFEERIRALRESFIAGLPDRLSTMRNALRCDDRATLHHEAHRLAGTGDTYGLPQLTTWARAFDHKIKSGATLAALDKELDELSDFLAKLIPLGALG